VHLLIVLQYLFRCVCKKIWNETSSCIAITTACPPAQISMTVYNGDLYWNNLRKFKLGWHLEAQTQARFRLPYFLHSLDLYIHVCIITFTAWNVFKSHGKICQKCLGFGPDKMLKIWKKSVKKNIKHLTWSCI